jgi:hypothetical protein
VVLTLLLLVEPRTFMAETPLAPCPWPAVLRIDVVTKWALFVVVIDLNVGKF